jgi:hypothetical protein
MYHQEHKRSPEAIHNVQKVLYMTALICAGQIAEHDPLVVSLA